MRREGEIGSWQATQVDSQKAAGRRLGLGLASRLVQLPVLVIASAIVFGLGALLVVQLLDDDAGEDALAGESGAPAVDPRPEGESAPVLTDSGIAQGTSELDLSAMPPDADADAEADPDDPATGRLASGEDTLPAAPTTAESGTSTFPTATTATTAKPATVTVEVPATTTTSAPEATVTRPTTTTRQAPTTSTTASTTTASTVRVTAAPTVAPTTTTTAPPTTTTTTPTTTTPPFPDTLIAMPVEGSDRRWDTAVRFSVNDVPGAVTYCWTFLPANHLVCRQTNSFTLPAQSSQVRPGPITVVVEARDAAGVRLMTEEARIDLAAPVQIVQPAVGSWIDVEASLPVAANPVRSADRYCWEFTQRGVTVGNICSPDASFELAADGSILGRLALVPVTIRLTVTSGSVILGEDSITLTVARRF